MKNFKKVLAFAVAVATLGSLAVTPVNAIINKDSQSSSLEWYAENAITEAIIHLDDAGENNGTYYWKNTFVESSIDLSSISEEDMAKLNRGFPVKIDDYSIDTSAVETVITVNKEDPSIAIDYGYYYTNMEYDYYMGDWLIEESAIQKPTTEDTTETEVTTATTEATTTESGSKSLYDSEWYAENAITEAIIHLDDAGENNGTYYFKTPGNEPSIDISYLSEEDTATLNKGFPVKIDDYSIDTSAVESVLYVDKSHNEYIPIDFGSTYTDMYYSYSLNDWLVLDIYIPKLTTDTTTTETEPTIGDSNSTEPSETTLQRGDVNGDGAINALDLLQLKKYILGIIDTLD